MRHYILDAEHRVTGTDLLTWSRWFGVVENRQLACTEIGHLLVLTTFVGIDLNFDEGKPMFFETKVMDDLEELECRQYSTWNEGLDGHNASVMRWSRWADAARGAAERTFAARCGSNRVLRSSQAMDAATGYAARSRAARGAA